MDNKQHEKEVHTLVNSLMKKLGITYSIDYRLTSSLRHPKIFIE